MAKYPAVKELWDSARSHDRIFQVSDVSRLPEAVRCYLEHAVAPGTALSRAVRLRMHGEIRLQRWLPFTAEQAINWDRGFIWSATVRMFGMPVRGFDRLLDGAGAMRWRLLGIIPVMTASGPDITRSAAGRLASEAVWLPSVLCGNEISWTVRDSSHIGAELTVCDETVELELTVEGDGRLGSIKLSRWGNPGDSGFRYEAFGGIVEKETTFGGYTIPTRLRAGWFFGTDRFEPEGEFIRVTIDEAEYR